MNNQPNISSEDNNSNRNNQQEMMKNVSAEGDINIDSLNQINIDKVVLTISSELEQSSKNNLPSSDQLVDQIKIIIFPKLKELFGTMRILRINYPVPVNKIFIDLNILEQISKDIEFENWKNDFTSDNLKDSINFYRLGLTQVKQEIIPALDILNKYKKLIVLGKPGSGKTTFIKSIIVSYLRQETRLKHKNLIPIFITLKEFSENIQEDINSSLLDFIKIKFNILGISNNHIVEKILNEGKVIILLDGLDEVSEKQSQQVVAQIKNFCDTFYKNRFLITCRTQSYKLRLQGFTDVEIADFDSNQVNRFIHNWFSITNKTNNSKLENKLINQLQLKENQQYAELTVTPVLLSLLCAVFCQLEKFPLDAVSLYSKSIKILLKDWDDFKGIKRQNVHKNIKSEDIESLLSYLAAILFKSDDYFPKRKKLENLISNYLEISSSESAFLLENIEEKYGLLIERSNGFYSFSHLTFQEYFTAKWFFKHPSWKELVNHIREPKWKQVFKMIIQMSPDKALVSIKYEIDMKLNSEPKLQKYLMWLYQEVISLEIPYNSVAVRAFYLALTIGIDSPLMTMLLDTRISYKVGSLYPLDINFLYKNIVSTKCQKGMEQLNIYRKFRDLFSINKWKFNEKQIKLMNSYYHANKSFVILLQSDRNLSNIKREHITNKLLLPLKMA